MDAWIPSSNIVEPEIADQVSFGYFRNFFDDKYETSVELYNKDLFNLIEYADGALPGDDIGDNADNYFIFINFFQIVFFNIIN